MALAHPATDSAVNKQVLTTVAQLVNELSGGAARPTLDDALDRNLGISSLERVELLLRLEQVFGVRLPDTVMAQAVTPRDLVDAIDSAVSFVEEHGDKGPQASTVKLLHPRRVHRSSHATTGARVIR